MRDDEELARAALDSARAALGADLAAVLAQDGRQLVVEITEPAASVPPVPARDAFGPSADAIAISEIPASELSPACPSPLRGTVLLVPIARAEAALAFIRRSGAPFGDPARAQVESRLEALGLAVRLLLREHRESGALARYEGILNASPNSVVFLDDDDRYTWANAAAGTLLEMPAGPTTTSAVTAALARFRDRSTNAREIAAWVREVLAKTDTQRYELAWLFREPLRAYSVWTKRAPIGRRGGRIWFLQDFSLAHFAAEALRTQNEALVAARAESDRANATKSDFLAVMSHEIRQPMNGVLGMAKLLLDTTLTAEQRDYADTIGTSADSLLAILNDILDLSKVEAGHLELEDVPFDLAACLDGAVAIFRVKALEKSVGLTAHLAESVPSVVRGDPTRLRQVLVNLIGNALKFTERGSVSIEVERATEDLLRFAVKDTGPGIAPEHIERLFQAFSQADASVARTHGGTGLGLAISKQLVARMGGRIGVDSERGAGSTFHFTARLPAVDGTCTPIAPAVAFDAELGERVPLRILVVDDSSVNQKVARLTLERLGYAPDAVGDGEEALAAMERAPYDVVFMDVHMPRMTGIEATRRARADPARYGKPRIVAMTASGTTKERARCLEAGMNASVSKPIVVAELARALRESAGVAGRDAPETPAPPSVAAVLDAGAVRALRELTAGDSSVFQDLVRTVIQGIDDGEREIARGLTDGDARAVMMAAHKLRGSTGMVGAAGAVDVLEVLEDAGRGGRLSALGNAPERMRAELAAVRVALNALAT